MGQPSIRDTTNTVLYTRPGRHTACAVFTHAVQYEGRLRSSKGRTRDSYYPVPAPRYSEPAESRMMRYLEYA